MDCQWKEISSLLVAKEIQTRRIDSVKTVLAKKTMWRGVTFFYAAKDLERVANRLGIEVRHTKEFFNVRDHFFRLSDGSLRLQRTSPHLSEAIERTHSYNLYFHQTAATCTKNQVFNSWTGYSQTLFPHVRHESQRLFGREPPSFSYSYVEGGNVWLLKGAQGEPTAIVGRDHFYQTFLMLDLENRNWEELAKEAGLSFSDLKEKISKNLTEEEIKQQAEKLFALGKGHIPHKAQIDLFMQKYYSGPSEISHEDSDWFRESAVKKGIIPPFEWEGSNAQKWRGAAAEFLAKEKVVYGLMALDLGVKKENLHFVTQVNYHLDAFMRPGPGKNVFLIHFKIWKELLEALKKNSLSALDQEVLERYMETSRKMDQELGPLLKQAQRELEEAGFQVIPMPGHLIYESKTMYQEFPMPSEGYNLNFINSLAGRSAKTGRDYYITYGAQVGEKLGDLLMDAFTLFLKSYVPEIEVFFIGRNPKTNDFAEAMDWWNRLETQSGIHCTTFELQKSD